MLKHLYAIVTLQFSTSKEIYIVVPTELHNVKENEIVQLN